MKDANACSLMQVKSQCLRHSSHNFMKITRDYFDATASNWNTSAQSRLQASHFV